MPYRTTNQQASKTVVIGVLSFWIMIAMLLMALMSGLYYHYQVGQKVGRYIHEHRCIQIENTSYWYCDEGIIEL